MRLGEAFRPHLINSLSGQIGQDWAGNLNWGGGVYFEHETSSAQNDDDTSGRVSAVMCPQFLCFKQPS